MKLKLLLFILLLPLSLFAANTNVFDRVLIRSDFQFTGGTPGAGKVLTADAAGNTSWVTPGSGSLLIGQTSLSLTETWLGTTWANLGTLSTNNTVSVGIQAGRNSTFGNGSVFIGSTSGNNATSASNSIFVGRLAGAGAANAAHSIMIGDNAGNADTVDNRVTGETILIGRNTSTGGFKNSIALGTGTTNSAAGQFRVGITYTNYVFRGVAYNMPSAQASGALQNDGSGNLTWTTVGSGAAAVTNAPNFFTFAAPNTYNALATFSNIWVIGSSTNGSSIFTPTTAQLGTNSAFVLTLSGITITAPSGLNINAGVQTFPATTAGTTTNGSAVGLFLGSLQTSSAGGIDTIAGAGTNFVWSANAGAGFGFIKARLTTQTNILGSIAVVNTVFTNPTQQRASINAAVILPTGVASQSQLQIWRTIAGTTNKYIMTSPMGVVGTVTNSSPTIWIDPGGTVLFTNTLTAAGAPTMDNVYSTTDYH